jgi:hypothetical protein
MGDRSKIERRRAETARQAETMPGVHICGDCVSLFAQELAKRKGG